MRYPIGTEFEGTTAVTEEVFSGVVVDIEEDQFYHVNWSDIDNVTRHTEDALDKVFQLENLKVVYDIDDIYNL